jgi:hypothetical protein
MSNIPRFIKMFSVTGRRFYKQGHSVRVDRPKPSIDEKVNSWVEETGNIIISATPGRHTVMEKDADGSIIRKTTQLMTVVYQSESSFVEAEAELRRRALILSPRQGGGVEDVPTAMSNDEEHRQKAQERVDSDAGGPDGVEGFFPADSDEDDF